MQFHLYKVAGYEEAIMSLRMSHGKFYSWEKAQEIQDLVYACTDKRGGIATEDVYRAHLISLDFYDHYGTRIGRDHNKVTGDYEKDIEELKRLLGLTMNNAMGEHDHHTLMKYIDISFFTDGLHRGAQDDLDAHAMGFNNRITRFSTRLAEIASPEVSDWYKGKIMPFYTAIELFNKSARYEDEIELPDVITDLDTGDKFLLTPFGYIHEKYANISDKNGLKKDVKRGLIGLAQPGPALWKTDLFNLRYIYYRRSRLTKANPELRDGMEQLFDQIEATIPVFGPLARMEYTDTGAWEHMNRVRTVTKEEYEMLQKLKADNLLK